MPPPFPFTPFLMAAAASNYPRKKLLAVVGVSRLLRFAIEGVLAILLGERILRLAQSSTVEYAVLGLLIVSLVASALSVYGWIRRSRIPTDGGNGQG